MIKEDFKLIFYIWDDVDKIIITYLKTLIELECFKNFMLSLNGFGKITYIFYPVPGENYYRKRYIPTYDGKLSNEVLDEAVYKMNYGIELSLYSSRKKEEFYTRFITWAEENNYQVFTNDPIAMSGAEYFSPRNYEEFYYK